MDVRPAAQIGGPQSPLGAQPRERLVRVGVGEHPLAAAGGGEEAGEEAVPGQVTLQPGGGQERRPWSGGW